MGIVDALKLRRSYYAINKSLPISEADVVSLIETVTELVPDAFNMKSARVAIALGEKQNEIWDGIYDAFGGKVPREKIDGFKAGAGTVFYFIDEETVAGLAAQFPDYAENFKSWALQANGMLQHSVWSALREVNIGANLQHYNPIIDDLVKRTFGLPAHYTLIAQMPFGGIVSEPEPKAAEDITARVVTAK